MNPYDFLNIKMDMTICQALQTLRALHEKMGQLGHENVGEDLEVASNSIFNGIVYHHNLAYQALHKEKNS